MARRLLSGRAEVPVLLVLLAACGVSVPADSADPSALDTSLVGDAVTVRRVGWHVAWDDAGVTRRDGGWTTTRDDGAVITVEEGYVALYAASLVPCEQSASVGDRAWDAALGVLLGRVALAGHAEGNDASTLPRPVVASLASAEDASLDELTFTAATYCQVHHVLAGATALGVGLPEDVDMTERSLVLSGTWQASVDAEPTPFRLETDASWGELTPLADAAMSGEGDRADVTLTRSLAGVFDGVDLGGDPDAAAEQALRNLAENVAVDVVLRGG